jgi:hypothetical protein
VKGSLLGATFALLAWQILSRPDLWEIGDRG